MAAVCNRLALHFLAKAKIAQPCLKAKAAAKVMTLATPKLALCVTSVDTQATAPTMVGAGPAKASPKLAKPVVAQAKVMEKDEAAANHARRAAVSNMEPTLNRRFVVPLGDNRLVVPEQDPALPVSAVLTSASMASTPSS